MLRTGTQGCLLLGLTAHELYIASFGELIFFPRMVRGGIIKRRWMDGQLDNEMSLQFLVIDVVLIKRKLMICYLLIIV